MKSTFAAVLLAIFATTPGHLTARSEAPLAVAAASDMRFALDELAAEFARRGGGKIQITYGSSGQFATQISQGAPYDLFFSADEDAISRLTARGLIVATTVHAYGIGRIVLWVPRDSSLDPGDGLSLLTTERVRFVAIANPEHAPYGRAAVQALRAAGIWDRVQRKLVLGENISQALQYVRTGNADVGIVALSLVVAEPVQSSGRYWRIPSSWYHPIRQTAGIVTSSVRREQGSAFLAFVNGPEGRKIMRRYGFAPPGKEP